MNKLNKLSNVLLFIGLGLTSVGLIHILDVSDHVFFKYTYGAGFLLIGLSILLSVFPIRRKSR
ncbi:hypothetical protein [Metabacillus malikii]|uniref:DUF3188 domain-containing protein n=1 Tax=Metabacillus malikii TaxID=1504265 RepID=A0ABT9ZBZ4_9BACI|nr:hypothetical protein [Metabacillus malikii]MDQ0229098.1 hypothetical protein [Metabacillus malikii]